MSWNEELTLGSLTAATTAALTTRSLTAILVASSPPPPDFNSAAPPERSGVDLDVEVEMRDGAVLLHEALGNDFAHPGEIDARAFAGLD